MNLRRAAIIELLFAASLWGFGFVAAVWALEQLNPFALTFIRFFVASLFLLPLLFWKAGRAEIHYHLRMAFLPGMFFAGTLLVQTWGLMYTTPTKSGFITTLYVVFIPLLQCWHTRRPLPGMLWFSVGVAFLGTALIVNLGMGSLNFGDLLTLVCALFATLQIYLIGMLSSQVRRPVIFNLVQASWAALACLPFAFDWKTWRTVGQFLNWQPHQQLGLIILCFGSTVIAFSLQVRAQKVLSPTVSSLLFLLESPFSMIFSILLLGQVLGPLESGGAVLIFASAFVASLFESRQSRKA